MRYRRIAQIVKVKGLNGEVVVIPTDDLPFHVGDTAPLYAEGVRVFIVPPDHDLIRQTRVLRATERGDGVLLALEGVTDRTTAQRLQGRFLLAEVGETDGGTPADAPAPFVLPLAPFPDTSATLATPQAPPGTPTPTPTPLVPSFAVGLEVEDETAGFIGTITEERLGAAQTLWVVQGLFGEVLIPAVDAFVCSWDAHAVRMRLPAGLLELNA